MSHPPRLTDDDRRIIADARELSTLGDDGICARWPQERHAASYASALGVAQYRLAQLADIAERLGGDGG